MKKTLLIAAIFAAAACVRPATNTVTSPDGSLKVTVDAPDGVLCYNVVKDNDTIISNSRLGFELMGGNILGIHTDVLSIDRSSADEEWETVWGEQRVIRDNHNGAVFHTAWLDVEVRVFDDGFGFRYIFPDSLGDIAIRYGHYRFQADIMWITIIVLIILVQIMQEIGIRLAARLDNRIN